MCVVGVVVVICLSVSKVTRRSSCQSNSQSNTTFVCRCSTTGGTENHLQLRNRPDLFTARSHFYQICFFFPEIRPLTAGLSPQMTIKSFLTNLQVHSQFGSRWPPHKAEVLAEPLIWDVNAAFVFQVAAGYLINFSTLSKF